jgi:hypothetical protein
MDDKFTLTKGDITKEVFMSYGLLDRLCRVAGDLEGGALMAIDNDVRAQMLIELLSERDEKGEILNGGVSPFQIPFTIPQLADLLSWAQEHVFDFFVKAAQTTRQKVDLHKAVITGLKVT